MVSKCIRLLLFSGAVLFLHGCTSVAYRPQLAQPAGIYHIVGSGQTLCGISRAYGVDMNEIMRVNNIQNPNHLGVGERLFIPHAESFLRVEPYRPLVPDAIEKIVGPKQYRVAWRTITLHHSGTQEGDAESFDRNHRRKGMGGLFYHFVIDSGTNGSQDGEIEVGWRWRRQAEVDRRRDIQICLVGNFNKQEISETQFNSLVNLLRVLMEQYSIPLSNIRRHKDIKGSITECPGGDFPFYRILAELRRG